MSKFSFLLWALFVFFLGLYWFDPIIVTRNFKDLWVSLLAGVIAALLIDRIIEHSNKEKQRLSREYVKSRLSRICTSLLSGMAPAIDWLDWGYFQWTWENTIKHEYDSKDWTWYYQHVNKSREEALKQIRYIVDNQRDLLEDELQNNIFVLLDGLEESGWEPWGGVETDDIWKLNRISELASKTSNEAFRILKEHDLLEYQQVSNYKISRISFKREIDKRQLKYDLAGEEKLLNQSVRFKDAVQAKAMPGLHLRKGDSEEG